MDISNQGILFSFPSFLINCFALSPSLRQECSWNLQVHLISWQHLAHLCMERKLYLYRLRPKHHSMDHIQMDIARTRLNPARASSCFSDESFLGYLKRIGVRCHSSNMMLRLLQRYILFLSLRWKDSRTKWDGVLCARQQSHGPVKTSEPYLMDVPPTVHTLLQVWMFCRNCFGTVDKWKSFIFYSWYCWIRSLDGKTNIFLVIMLSWVIFWPLPENNSAMAGGFIDETHRVFPYKGSVFFYISGVTYIVIFPLLGGKRLHWLHRILLGWCWGTTMSRTLQRVFWLDVL